MYNSIKNIYFSPQTQTACHVENQSTVLYACAHDYLTITYISDSQNIKGTVLEERLQHLLPVKVGHQTFYG